MLVSKLQAWKPRLGSLLGLMNGKRELASPAFSPDALGNELVDKMNSKQRKTLAAIFTDPVSKNIEWQAVESLLVAVGADVVEGCGSRVKFHKDGVIATFHRPHPNKEANPYQVRDVRRFLSRLGVKP